MTEWGATPIDFVIILMGLGVVLWVLPLRHSVIQHDKLLLVHSWIIKLKWGIRTTKNHRSGDYEIVDPLNDDDTASK